MRRPSFLLLALASLVAAPASAQGLPFAVEIVERPHTQAPAVHSAAVAHHGGLWLFVTGRRDGIHPFLTTPQAFPFSDSNGLVSVYDPEADVRWDAPLSELPEAVERSLRVTNPQFWQDGPTLYVVGGYGRPASGPARTYDTLTAIDVPGLIAAVQTGQPLGPHLRQTSAPFLAVTGGFLVPEDGAAGRYALVGGHRFDGEYLRPSQVQVYTDAIRRFTLTDDGSTLSVGALDELNAPDLFHRRDGNLAPVVLPGGEMGYALYGGVFTAETLPYRTPILVTPSGVTELPFEARFGHYTTPVLPMVDAEGTMHTVFFGGMNLYTVDNATGVVTRDGDVPFVDDVTALSIAADRSVAEAVLPVTMPGRLGTNAHLIPDDGLPRTPNGVLRLADLGGRTRVGRIHGGIEADEAHPALLGRARTASRATPRTFDVYVTAQPVSGASAPDTPGALALAAPVPNPTVGGASVVLTLAAPADVRVDVLDPLGRRVARLHDGPLAGGVHRLVVAPGLAAGVYVVRATAAGETRAHRLVVR